MSDILNAIGNTPIVKLKNIVHIGCGKFMLNSKYLIQLDQKKIGWHYQ